MDEHLKWPGWERVRKLGEGSFGAVYEIQRNVFGKIEKAALKIISIPQNPADIDNLIGDGYDLESISRIYQRQLENIVQEYSLMAEFKGISNIVNCDDVQYFPKKQGVGWDILIKMELLTPLGKVLDQNFNEEQVVRLGIDICNALTLCKSKNIVHRDIKPQNILVSNYGQYKLADFGIAKIAEKTSCGTKTGTYNYMAPEVYNNQPYGSAADIYSLGMVLYWMLNEHRTPFLTLPPQTPDWDEMENALHRRFQGEPLPAPAHGSKKLKEIVLKSCAYRPENRYVDAAQMCADLKKILQQTEEEESKTVAVQKLVDLPPKFEKKVEPPVFENRQQMKTTYGNVGKPAKSGKKKGIFIILILCAVIGIIGILFFTIKLKDTESSVEAEKDQEENTTDVAQDDVGSTEESRMDIDDINVGDIYTFGSYEQDNNEANGKEMIEWQVLDKEGTKILVISKYGLDDQLYNIEDADVTWETCSLRSWLNNDFINAAFSNEEKAMIPTVTVTADKNTDCNTDPGNDTQDKVFLLSIAEVSQYFNSDNERQCEATAYANGQGVWSNRVDNTCGWWLRSPGNYQNAAACVYDSGSISVYGTCVYEAPNDRLGHAVRPALWIDLEPTVEAPIEENDDDNLTEQNQKDINVGDIYTFGTYEQDNNETNGKEDIRWQVLAKEGTKILVVSECALDCQQYNTEWVGITWETCSLREWLNNDFINTAFSEDERAMIPTVTVTADKNPYYDLDPGNDTQDKVFLLSILEVEKYFDSDAARECEVTAYAEAQGVWTINVERTCAWWLRSPGESLIGASFVGSNGGVYALGSYVTYVDTAVRPALWIDLGY